ncbi:hypothetical protein ACIO1C_29535 [Streptomyces sp. NPDC087420]|uniref:hypothetical protein n=1 Tax=Streptomyces sp. NPDC087420 TaxID=3365785 RepID=UPI0038350D26
MSEHLPHDLPEYVPNWPVPVIVKVKVRRLRRLGGWSWFHHCPHRQVIATEFKMPSQRAAFAAALKHAQGCW